MMPLKLAEKDSGEVDPSRGLKQKSSWIAVLLTELRLSLSSSDLHQTHDNGAFYVASINGDNGCVFCNAGLCAFGACW